MVKPIRFGQGGERDVGSPVSTAKIYDSQDADELVFLDITASSESHGLMLDAISEVAKRCFIPLTAGGGVRSTDDFRRILRAGADKVSINTHAVDDPDLISRAAQIFGNQCVIVSIDVKKVESGIYRVYTHRGTVDSGLEMIDWAKRAVDMGAGEILLTSIDNEGMMRGYDLDMIRMVSDAVNVPVIANGGAGTRQDFVDVVQIGRASAVAASSVFHFSDSNLTQVKTFIYNSGVPVRPI